MLRLLVLFFLPLFLYAQSSDWNSVVDLNLSVNSGDRIDLYTDKDGNHVLVENGSTLKYYLYSPTGTQVRTSTIDASISATFSKITGWDETIYISYKEGSTIYTKKSTNAGQSWSSIDNISMDDSDSDGLELWTDSNGLHVVYSEWDDANSVFEIHYKLNEVGETDWVNDKTVTDESGVSGGTPSITSSSGRIHVGFQDYEQDEVKTRDKASSSWETSQDVYTTYPARISVIATSGKLHALFGKIVDPNIYLYYKNRDISGTTWSSAIQLADGHGTSEYNKPDMTVTDNDKMHLVYNYGGVDSYYREWDSSMSSLFDFTPDATADGGYTQRISSQENDLYTLWISDDGASGYELKLRQRDYAPKMLTNFDDSWSSGHPRVTWDESEATDFDEYIVEKSDDGSSYSTQATISTRTTTEYVDTGEFQFSGGTRDWVWYRVKQKDIEGNASAATSSIRFTVNAPENSINVISLQHQNIQIADFRLNSNYPNPFNPETKISFSLPEPSTVTLDVFDVSGKKVVNLISGTQESGIYTTTFNAHNLPSAIYIYKMEVKGLESGKNFSDVKRMLLLK